MTHFICNVMLMAEIHIEMTTRFTATTFVCDLRSPILCIRHMRGTACFALRRRLCVGDRSHDSWVAMTREKRKSYTSFAVLSPVHSQSHWVVANHTSVFWSCRNGSTESRKSTRIRPLRPPRRECTPLFGCPSRKAGFTDLNVSG